MQNIPQAAQTVYEMHDQLIMCKIENRMRMIAERLEKYGNTTDHPELQIDLRRKDAKRQMQNLESQLEIESLFKSPPPGLSGPNPLTCPLPPDGDRETFDRNMALLKLESTAQMLEDELKLLDPEVSSAGTPPIASDLTLREKRAVSLINKYNLLIKAVKLEHRQKHAELYTDHIKSATTHITSDEYKKRWSKAMSRKLMAENHKRVINIERMASHRAYECKKMGISLKMPSHAEMLEREQAAYTACQEACNARYRAQLVCANSMDPLLLPPPSQNTANDPSVWVRGLIPCGGGDEDTAGTDDFCTLDMLDL